MMRRSFYLPVATVEALAAAADDIHYGSHGKIPKHEALAAIVQAGLRDITAVKKELRSRA